MITTRNTPADEQDCPTQFRRNLPKYDPRAEKVTWWIIPFLVLAIVLTTGAIYLWGRG